MSKLPNLNELLNYKNEELLKRYKKDYPENKFTAEEALTELLKYFWLVKKHEQDKKFSPTKKSLQFNCAMHFEMQEIDDMWHTFLLFTQDYARFCDYYFGEFIHHVPNTEETKLSQGKFKKDFKLYLSYIYDTLGEATLKKWFVSLLVDSDPIKSDENNQWQTRWEAGILPFHKEKIDSRLPFYIKQLGIKTDQRIFVPLCGKSLDMLYFLQQGIKVTGVELSPIACQDFFVENNLSFTVSREEKFVCYGNENIELLCGDIFDLDPNQIDRFDAIYDCAALIAIPINKRQKYVDTLIRLGCRKLLLVVMESKYKAKSAPFPISEIEIKNLFANSYSVSSLKKNIIAKPPAHLIKSGLKEIASAVYLLQKD